MYGNKSRDRSASASVDETWSQHCTFAFGTVCVVNVVDFYMCMLLYVKCATRARAVTYWISEILSGGTSSETYKQRGVRCDKAADVQSRESCVREGATEPGDIQLGDNGTDTDNVSALSSSDTLWLKCSLASVQDGLNVPRHNVFLSRRDTGVTPAAASSAVS